MTRRPPSEPSAAGLLVFMVLASIAVAAVSVWWIAGGRLG